MRALLEHNDKIFVSRGIGDNVWEFPGGRMHIGEEPEQGLLRELKEELGIDAKVGTLFYTQTFMHMRDKTPQLMMVYHCTMYDQEIQIDPAEVEEFKWLSRSELKTLPMFDDCRNAADKFLK